MTAEEKLSYIDFEKWFRYKKFFKIYKISDVIKDSKLSFKLLKEPGPINKFIQYSMIMYNNDVIVREWKATYGIDRKTAKEEFLYILMCYLKPKLKLSKIYEHILHTNYY